MPESVAQLRSKFCTGELSLAIRIWCTPPGTKTEQPGAQP